MRRSTPPPAKTAWRDAAALRLRALGLNTVLFAQSYPVLVAGGVGLVLAGVALEVVQVPIAGPHRTLCNAGSDPTRGGDAGTDMASL